MLHVTLSFQDLGDFLENDSDAMESYRVELQKRLQNYYGNANVEIDSNALTDKIETEDYENEESVKDVVYHIMNQMTESWDWLE